MNKNRTLKLTIKRQSVEVMKTSEKMAEYRKPSKWLLSRLYDKDGMEKEYDYVEFSNGYGADVLRFKAVYCGFEICEDDQTLTFSNGLVVEVEKGDFMIQYLRERDVKALVSQMKFFGEIVEHLSDNDEDETSLSEKN